MALSTHPKEGWLYVIHFLLKYHVADLETHFFLRLKVIKRLSFSSVCRTQRFVPTLEAGHLHMQKAKLTEMRLTFVWTLQKK